MQTPFQSSVLRKHLDALDGAACKQAYDRLQAYFGDRDMQSKIVGMKEEQFQGPFLERLFGNVLGYTAQWEHGDGYNLVAERKNVKNAKKADGAILRPVNEVHAVIELKSTSTIDLNRVEAQAFGYKSEHPECRYVITSNFQRLRFYVGDTTFYLEWNLFGCTYEDFRVLYLCLECNNLLSDLPNKVRQESTVKEEEITKELYRDYTAFKRDLFGHLQTAYPERDKLRLFQLSQKLLDRLLFVFFGEDKGLLPANTASKPIGDFDQLRKIDADQPLYSLLNKYFGYIDRGHQREGWKIHAYNGGLFAKDEELESLEIPDELLRKHLLKLTAYKFDSEVDVNILGHIFEHSLNEIEEVQAEIRGEAVDKSKTKRKKDGVFYTPRYITKYIVENTVGRLCLEKRAELQIDEQDYARGRKGRRKDTVMALRQNLERYRAWLLDLKICDPACGSGAFLNEALDFLIQEHNNVSELERQLFESTIAFDPGPAILERNLYGVDINDEAIEIARLSLWLRTAEPGRTLTDLSGRIKVGNSLIDDPAVAGEKAFVWAEEFPEVFGEGTRGGFDVVVGNPPYVQSQATGLSDEVVAYLKANFDSAAYKLDLYTLFIEQSVKVVRRDALIGLITPNTFLNNRYHDGLREYIRNESEILQIVDTGAEVFDQVSVDSLISVFRKTPTPGGPCLVRHLRAETLADVDTVAWKELQSPPLFEIRVGQKSGLSFENTTPLGAGWAVYFGIQAHNKRASTSNSMDSAHHLPIVQGADLARNARAEPQAYYDFREVTIKSGGHWTVHQQDRVVIRQIGPYPIASLVAGGVVTSNTMYNITRSAAKMSLECLMGILNSKLMYRYWDETYSDGKKLFPKIKGYQIKQLPIANGDSEVEERITGYVKRTVQTTQMAQALTATFLRALHRRFPDLPLSRKLEDWPSLDFADFVGEVNKALKKGKLAPLSLAQEMEWESLFEGKRAEVQGLRGEILRLDREIDVAVYRLYGLSWAEVLVVDAGVEEWLEDERYRKL